MTVAVKVLLSPSAAFFTLFFIACVVTSCPIPMPPSCSCSRYGFGFRLLCPAFDMNVRDNNYRLYIDIHCTSDDISALLVLDFQTLFGTFFTSVKTLTIRGCPLYSHSTLAQYMQSVRVVLGYHGPSFGKNKTEKRPAEPGQFYNDVKIQYSNTINMAMTHELFKFLSNESILKLYANGVVKLSDSVFTSMPNLRLTELFAEYTKVVKPKITKYDGLSRLAKDTEIATVSLQLTSDNLMYLQPGFFHHLSNLQELYLLGNIRNLSRDVFTGMHSLERLDISRNELSSLPSELFIDLINLRGIKLQSNAFPSFSQNLLMKNHNLQRDHEHGTAIKTLPSRMLAGLTKLETVEIVSCNMSTVSADLLHGSTSVNSISLNHNAFTALPKELFRDCRELTTLDVSFNRITELPDQLFSNTKKMEILKLNNNHLSAITDDLFKQLQNLKILHLHNNRLKHIGTSALLRLYSLSEINMDNNKLTLEGDTDKGNSLLSVSSKLEDIHLANNYITKIFTDWRELKSLKNLDLSHNQISQMKTADFNFTGREDIVVDLSYNDISKISIFDTERVYRYAFKTKTPKVPVKYFSIENNPIICSCGYYTLLQYDGDIIYAEIRLEMETKISNAQCVNFGEYAEQLMKPIPIKPFSCLFEQDYCLNCPQQCNYLIRPTDEALIIDCYERNLTSMPKDLPDLGGFSSYTELNLYGNKIESVKSPLGPGYHKVTKYILSDNAISEINLTAISPEVQVLELDGNKLSQFNEPLTEFLMNAKYLTQLTIHQNPWRCDCTTKEFVDEIQKNYTLGKIQLRDNITCVNGTKILNISLTELCLVELQSEIRYRYIGYVSLIVAAFGLFGIIFGLFFKFQKEIKVWLYAHRCCLWFINEEELDRDKFYDAFVSYSQLDEDFIVDHLVPGLENGPIKYKLCLHQRNWLGGDHIPTQIARSVEASRRTLIVMSPNFLGSEWGKMEFRAAHKQALRERRIRVIIIMYGDIGATDKLDPELQVYLRMNTYIKWGDPRFWEKLRYALPHTTESREGIPLQEIRKTELNGRWKNVMEELSLKISPVQSRSLDIS